MAESPVEIDQHKTNSAIDTYCMCNQCQAQLVNIAVCDEVLRLRKTYKAEEQTLVKQLQNQPNTNCEKKANSSTISNPGNSNQPNALPTSSSGANVGLTAEMNLRCHHISQTLFKNTDKLEELHDMVLEKEQILLNLGYTPQRIAEMREIFGFEKAVDIVHFYRENNSSDSESEDSDYNDDDDDESEDEEDEDENNPKRCRLEE